MTSGVRVPTRAGIATGHGNGRGDTDRGHEPETPGTFKFISLTPEVVMGAKSRKDGKRVQTRTLKAQQNQCGVAVPLTEAEMEKQLVERLKRGDEGALEYLMTKYHDKLRAVSLGICTNPEDVEEVLQDVYMTLLRKADQFEGRSAFTTWLHRITVNHSLMKIRKQRRTTYQFSIDPYLALLSLDEVDAQPKKQSPEDILFAKELWNNVRHAMNDLPEHYRRVFHLRDIVGLSTRETSECLNLTNKTTKSRLRRSRIHVGRSLSGLQTAIG
jgi:RNA polymerase sigma-70 factor, ECF subfamily